VAAILNDQGAELVDTSFVEANEIPAGQVVRGCFLIRKNARNLPAAASSSAQLGPGSWPACRVGA
jgi:hypothetical protein